MLLFPLQTEYWTPDGKKPQWQTFICHVGNQIPGDGHVFSFFLVLARFTTGCSAKTTTKTTILEIQKKKKFCIGPFKHIAVNLPGNDWQPGLHTSSGTMQQLSPQAISWRPGRCLTVRSDWNFLTWPIQDSSRTLIARVSQVLAAESWERAQPGNLKVKGVLLIAESITPKWSKSHVAKHEVQRANLLWLRT